MKFKTTRKAVMDGYNNVIGVSYCGLQSLLRCTRETAYTVRREGWGADIYDFDNTAIVTGYAPFGNVRPTYDVCQKYERAAEKINGNHKMSYDYQKEQLNALIQEFIKEVTQ